LNELAPGAVKKMDTRLSFEIVGGAVLIFLGIVFVITLGLGILDLTTDAIFVIFGVLMIRGAYRKDKLASAQLLSWKENRAIRRANKKEKPKN
jgi:ABC-type protease/lipase transport system fused ATPase/permease subunit